MSKKGKKKINNIDQCEKGSKDAPNKRAYTPKAKRSDWGTPEELFNELTLEYGPFDLDAAANETNALCAKYWTEDDNGLTQPWEGRVFVNPPYGRGLGRWVEKARNAIRLGEASVVVMLLPAHSFLSSDAFHRHIWNPHSAFGNPVIDFRNGKLRFADAENVAPFASMIVVWLGQSEFDKKENELAQERSRWKGVARILATDAHENHFKFRRGLWTIEDEGSVTCYYNNNPWADNSFRREAETQHFRRLITEEGIKELAYVTYPRNGYTFVMMLDAVRWTPSSRPK